LEFRLTEEVPLTCEWGFDYHVDCGIWLIANRKRTRYGGVGVVVDLIPAKRDGRYENKLSFARTNLRRLDIHVHPVHRDECNKIVVRKTARKIIDELVERSKINSLPI